MTDPDFPSKTSSLSDEVFGIQYQAASDTLDIFADLLAGEGLTPCTWQRPEDAVGILSLYLEEETMAADVKRQVDRNLAVWQEFLPDTVEALPIIRIPRENWAESWKRFFHTQQMSERIVVKPTWEDYTPLAGQIIVEIDPGMSFGTGQHGTTVACLQFLDELATGDRKLSLADAGCGSGILSIAGARLGYAPIDAFDYDPVAVSVATENCELNRVDTAVALTRGDVTAWEPAAPYDVVVANILAPVLIENAAIVSRAVADGGRLILSGILTEQFGDVQAAYAGCGFQCLSQRTIAEWTSGLFARADA